MEIWIFNGNNSSFPSGVFSTMEIADAWIRKYKLSGVLTKYPLDEGVYDWALTTATSKSKKKNKPSQSLFSRSHQRTRNIITMKKVSLT